MNSLRVATVRDATNKDSQLPLNFTKLADELLSEVIDVTVDSNAGIVSKVVSILTVMAEFINVEKKKEEKKNQDKKGSANSKQLQEE